MSSTPVQSLMTMFLTSGPYRRLYTGWNSGTVNACSPIFLSSAPQRLAAASRSVNLLIESISSLTDLSSRKPVLKFAPSLTICLPSKIGARNGPPEGQSAPQCARKKPGSFLALWIVSE